MAGSSKILTTVSLSFFTIVGLVPAGANNPNHAPVAISTPNSFKVGKSGIAVILFLDDTAIALSCPALMSGITEGAVANINCKRPAIKSRVASAPLYGM